MLVGEREGDDMARMAEQFRAQACRNHDSWRRAIADGEHNEGVWLSEFPAAVQWLFEAP